MRALVTGLVVGMLGLSSLVAAPGARACFDGSVSEVGRLSYQGGDPTWSAVTAVEHARWLTRIDRILPDGATLEIWDTAQLEVDGESFELRWHDDFEKLFDLVARKVHAGPIQRELVRRMDVPVWTIQAGAFVSQAVAQQRVDLIGGNCQHGFYEAGGFPAFNPTSHIERNIDGSFRVIVGTFLTREAAQAASACLAELTTYDEQSGEEGTAAIEGFVRRLDRPSFLAFAPAATPVMTAIGR